MGPETLPSTRRTRTLGLGAAARHFNDLAVPGLGGIWFGKQALLATLGVLIAEQARSKGVKVQNIEVANAIEALACWQAFNGNGWSSDPRLRGSTKLRRNSDDFSFARARQRNFYVTQPMRMATVQALPALGFVDSEGARFNAFRISDTGKAFVDQACQGFRPYRRSVSQYLTKWVCGQVGRVASNELREALSPLVPLNRNVCTLFYERLKQGGQERSDDKQRRRDALAWVEALRDTTPAQLTWAIRPKEISDTHWLDLMAGARFFRVREAAIRVLDALEVHIGNQVLGATYSLRASIPNVLSPLLNALSEAAREFLDAGHADKDAESFCRRCVERDASQVLRFLVERDGHVLRLLGDDVRPGPAFRGSEAASDEQGVEPADLSTGENIPLPDGISYRMHNLYLLNVDLHGGLSEWLHPIPTEDAHES
ncbi:hypothetical protein [Castellaniella caeni]|uniref:hypothetical protein n=1 Tax=Castellaniella caeni TaxID=266123 RepID=UPI0011AFC397|nr:hypothetical protein [Castellaniella caeni]